MQRTFVALSCAFLLAGGSALAQPQNSGSGSAASSDTAAPSLTDKAKHAAQVIGEKTREAVGKVKDMANDTAQKSKTGADQKTTQTGEMQKRADADLKSAKAKCASAQPQVQKTVCEKQAAVAHANAELRIARANAAAQGGNTSAMGAGKSAQ